MEGTGALKIGEFGQGSRVVILSLVLLQGPGIQTKRPAPQLSTRSVAKSRVKGLDLSFWLLFGTTWAPQRQLNLRSEVASKG